MAKRKKVLELTLEKDEAQEIFKLVRNELWTCKYSINGIGYIHKRRLEFLTSIANELATTFNLKEPEPGKMVKSAPSMNAVETIKRARSRKNTPPVSPVAAEATPSKKPKAEKPKATKKVAVKSKVKEVETNKDEKKKTGPHILPPPIGFRIGKSRRVV